MLTIEHCDIKESLKIGDLFDQIGFSSDFVATDDEGDSFITNTWPVEVLSLDSYYPVEGFRWTKLEPMVRVTHKILRTDGTSFAGKDLECSPDHIVLQQNPNNWTKIKDLKAGDFIATLHGISQIETIENLDRIERLCDLQVAIAHSYYSNDILSHNSHFLINLGASALKAGINVLHYTFELSENAIGLRYDSCLCNIDSNTVIDNKDFVLESYKDMNLGRLIIKEFPTNSASVYTIRSHIERLSVKGFVPGLIIIDYADIMRSTRQYDSLRHELKLIYEELRGLASEKGIPIWTASQSNKEGSQSDIVDLSNMSEAYGKAHVADIVVGISRKSHEKSSGFGRLYIAKNRAGRDGLVFPVKIDTARSRFEILGAEGSIEAATKENDDDMKKALRQKWKELKSDPGFIKKTEALEI
jgi:hypothetical protein